jgi:CubicO group peptidase (beta-lactamase class C family)/transglutaminase-like putative cysteine protease
MICRLKYDARMVALGSLLILGSLRLSALADQADGVIHQARAAADLGDFQRAESLLRTATTHAGAPVEGAAAIELEILRRIRLDYSLTEEALLAKLRKSIPDVAAGDLTRWRHDKCLQYRQIDGKVCYFKREPSNLFRFCDEAQKRRQPPQLPQPAGWKFALTDHLERLVALADKKDQAELFPVRHRVSYRLSVEEGHPHVKAGAKVRCWLPFPQAYRQQRGVRLVESTPVAGLVSDNGAGHRCVYFEKEVEDPAKPLRFSVTFDFVTSAYCPDLDPAAVVPYDTESALFRQYTAERTPHIVFSSEVRQIVSQVVGDVSNPLTKAQRLFRWVDEHIRYCAEMEYSTLPNLSAKALESRRGDCGVQAICFITLCRAAGIPARWQSGWETKPNGSNMHDWAEFYVEPWGWLPADPSYGLQSHEDRRVREFYCGHMDPYRLIVNLDYGQKLAPEKTSFRSEPNDFQRGEIEIDGHNLYFDEWDWTFDVQTVPTIRGFTALEEALDAEMPRRLVAGDVPGAVVLVGKNNGSGYDTWAKSYGYQQIKPTAVPMPVDAIFDLASMSKPIATGTALMILSEQGKVDVDEPVAKYLPEFKLGNKQNVTIRHLMTHMSGERPYVGAADQKVVEAEAGFPCRDAIRKYIRELPLVREPGAAVQYSCLNAILCAEIVRAITGMEHSEFVKQNAFQPLLMKETGFNPGREYDARLVPTEACDYGRGDGKFRLGQVHDPLAAMQAGLSGNAGLFSSAQDLSRFAQMVLNQGELDGVRILQPETVQRMSSVQNPGGKSTKGFADRRGLLWDIYQPDPGDEGIDAVYGFGHTGYTGTAIRFYPSHGVYVLALTNRVHPDDHARVGALRAAVWRIVGETMMGITSPDR